MASRKKVLHIILTVFSVFVTAGMILCAYIGYISPAESKIAGLLPLTFPAWIAAVLLVGIIDLLFCRRAALIPLAGLLISAGPVLDYCPLHPFAGQAADKPAIRLVTYNALRFMSTIPDDPYPGGVNPTISYIIGCGADIVAVQESLPAWPNKRLCITQAQIDSLKEVYPYILFDDFSESSLMSKYPFSLRSMPSDLNRHVMCADIAVGSDTIRIYSVHLQSFQLNDEDKRLYHDIATLEGSRSELREVKSVLLTKLTSANTARAVQADTLRDIIDSDPADNVIVCGDFNDVASSYTVRTVCRACGGLSQAYADAGFGPMVTYNRRSFPFRIDHVLYRGDLKAVEAKHGDIRSSDHYPLMVVFSTGMSGASDKTINKTNQNK